MLGLRVRCWEKPQVRSSDNADVAICCSNSPIPAVVWRLGTSAAFHGRETVTPRPDAEARSKLFLMDTLRTSSSISTDLVV